MKAKNSLFVRPPTQADLAAVAAINNVYLGNGTMQLQPVSSRDFHPYLPRYSNGHALLVGVLDASVIGYSLVKPYSEREGYRRAGETSVYLRPTATGQGYGKQLMKGILEHARHLGYHYLAAKIWTNNKKSISFLKDLGYRIVGIQHGIGWVKNRQVDVTLMEYALSEEGSGN